MIFNFYSRNAGWIIGGIVAASLLTECANARPTDTRLCRPRQVIAFVLAQHAAQGAQVHLKLNSEGALEVTVNSTTTIWEPYEGLFCMQPHLTQHGA